ncbi:MAG: metalloregulator ArsR/SmtB family transcription factor [Clostridiales bacterium]|nr:metalloregulator ArsR/SmtB family transcription factor [Clostridiales bacterium]
MTLQLPHEHGKNIDTILSQSPSVTDFEIVADLFRQLNDPSRLRLFWILCHCEECVINLSSMMEMSSPALSHHLRQLKLSGLITSRRDGKEMYYRAADTIQANALHKIIEQMIEISCPDTIEHGGKD